MAGEKDVRWYPLPQFQQQGGEFLCLHPDLVTPGPDRGFQAAMIRRSFA